MDKKQTLTDRWIELLKQEVRREIIGEIQNMEDYFIAQSVTKTALEDKKREAQTIIDYLRARNDGRDWVKESENNHAK